MSFMCTICMCVCMVVNVTFFFPLLAHAFIICHGVNWGSGIMEYANELYLICVMNFP